MAVLKRPAKCGDCPQFQVLREPARAEWGGRCACLKLGRDAFSDSCDQPRNLSSDELAEAIRMARMVGMPYRLDWSLATGVQTLFTPNGFKRWKKRCFLFGRELPPKEVVRT